MTKQAASTDGIDAELIAKRLELIELEQRANQRRHEQDAAARTPPPKPWWASALEFLALPAAILAIVIQFTQASGNVQTAEKTAAETSKLKTEEVKTRVELQNMLDELAETKKKGVVAYREEVERTMPQLQQTIERLRLIESQSGSASLSRSLAKYVLLWVLFHFISLVFDVIYEVWNAMTSAARNLAWGIRFKDKDGKEDYKKRERLSRFIQWADLVIRPAPIILRWSLQLSIFFTLMVPLFNEIAASIGAATTFEVFMQQAKQLEVGVALSTMKQILFGVPVR